jgi:hypothetical protein
MFRRLRILEFALLLLVVDVASAYSGVVRSFSSGPWVGRVWYGTSSQKFEYCSIARQQHTDATLIFRMHADYVFSISLGNENWVLKKGQEVPVSFSINGRSLATTIGKAVAPNQFIAPFHLDAIDIELLRYGTVLDVQTGFATERFTLDGSRTALNMLAECAISELQDAG